MKFPLERPSYHQYLLRKRCLRCFALVFWLGKTIFRSSGFLDVEPVKNPIPPLPHRVRGSTKLSESKERQKSNPPHVKRLTDQTVMSISRQSDQYKLLFCPFSKSNGNMLEHSHYWRKENNQANYLNNPYYQRPCPIFCI